MIPTNIQSIIDKCKEDFRGFHEDDIIEECMKEYARIKCLEAIRNTRYAAIDIITHHIDSQFNLPVEENDVHDLIRDIQNIKNEDVLPEL